MKNDYDITDEYNKRTETSKYPQDCYARNAKVWLWLLAFVTTISMVCVVDMLLTENRGAPVKYVGTPAEVAARPVAMELCPYCPGYLDAQGRCNVVECPIYDPTWGQPVAQMVALAEPVLIKELAMEVYDPYNKGTVLAHDVYVGGFADKAGLKQGDMIVKFNGRRVKGLKDFQAAASRALPEAKIKTEVLRNGKRLVFTVIIGEGEMEGAVIPVMNPGAAAGGSQAF